MYTVWFTLLVLLVGGLLLALFVGVIVATLRLHWEPLAQNHRHSRGLCPQCGYDVRASTTRCPECGSSLYSWLPFHGTASRHPLLILVCRILAVLIAVLLIVGTCAGLNRWF